MCADVLEYFQEIHLADTRIDKRCEDLQRLRSLREKVTTVYSLAPASGSGNEDKLCNITKKIFDLENELNQKVDAFVDLKIEARGFMEQLRDSRMIEVIDKTYFDYKSFDDIAKELGYCERTIRNIHDDAIEALEAIMDGFADRKDKGGEGAIS